MATRFSSQIPVTNQTFEMLPIFHTSDAFAARSHIENSEIVTTDVCDVFKEKITYFFTAVPYTSMRSQMMQVRTSPYIRSHL